MKFTKILKVIFLSFIVLYALGTLAFKYEFDVLDYKPTDEAVAYLNCDNNVTVCEEDTYISFDPVKPKDGIIFYSGARIENTSYAPLMYKLAKLGHECILLDIKDNFALFNPDVADDVQDKYPEIKDWYLMGHSLGGVVASMYLSKHADEYEGIIYLASYTISNLSEYKNLKILSIYGSNDGVLNLKHYTKAKSKYPNIEEHIIEGGIHAYFGMYGFQDGDGTPSITNIEQLNETVRIIDDFINKK